MYVSLCYTWIEIKAINKAKTHRQWFVIKVSYS
jgi:hypothetical protein